MPENIETEGEKREIISTEKACENFKEEGYRAWELRGDFATAGIKKMAKRTFQELASNIEELIVNAYDADATIVQVILNYDNNSLNIIDDGNGMDEKSLALYVIYGESNKTGAFRSPKFERAPIGEYGMGGKLAIANICKVCRIVTRKDGKEHIFGMNRTDLEKAKYVSGIKSPVYTKECDSSLHGTSVYMEELNYKNVDRERLIERFSSKMPKSQNFKIILATVKNDERREVEIEEPVFGYIKEFPFEENLSLVGKVKLIIYYTNEAIPVLKQGIWVRVNNRTVNEKAEWFDLFRMTSGNRYRYRLYGYAEVDGLRDFVSFSKNSFIDGPEFKEFWDFGHACMSKVQNILLKEDEDAKREEDRNLVKKVENEVNDVVSQLDNPLVLGDLSAKIKKEFTKDIENAPENPFPDFEKAEEEANRVVNIVTRGKDKRERRNQSLSPSEKRTYSGKNYIINTIDLSGNGDLVIFTKEKNLIEINEKHKFFINASKNGYLDNLVRDLAFVEIANDYSEGNQIIFNRVFNELARLTAQKPA